MTAIGQAKVGESPIGDNAGVKRLDAEGTGIGTGSASLGRITVLSTTQGAPIGQAAIGSEPVGGQEGGHGTGTGSASLARVTAFLGSGSGIGTGSASLKRTTAFAASGTGVGTGGANLIQAIFIEASGTGVGTGVAVMYGVDSPVSWTVHLKNESDVEADAITSDWPQITRGQTTTVRLWIDDREGEWDRLHDLLDWADAAAYGQGIDHTPWYREQLPSGADVDSIVVGVEPAQKLLDRDVEGVWGIVVGGRDTRNAPLTNWTLELDLLVLAESHEYDTHSEIESAFQA